VKGGATAYHGGRVAEDQVARHYADRGLIIAARRWRGQSGEIDLILRDGHALVFVEVKRAETLALAAERLRPRQIARIAAAASEYLACAPAGQDTDMRFDLALVDGQGRIEVIANAFSP